MSTVRYATVEFSVDTTKAVQAMRELADAMANFAGWFADLDPDVQATLVALTSPPRHRRRRPRYGSLYNRSRK